MSDLYFARSASDRTDDWPLWFVAAPGRGGLNVTLELIRRHIDPDYERGREGAVYMPRESAELLARTANGAPAIMNAGGAE